MLEPLEYTYVALLEILAVEVAQSYVPIATTFGIPSHSSDRSL
jgi:hypothetical protein